MGGFYYISRATKANGADLPHDYLNPTAWDFQDTNGYFRILDSTMILAKVNYSSGDFGKNAITTHRGGMEVLNARAIEFEPTLRMNFLPDVLQTRTGDPSRPIFGFKYVRGTILSNPNDSNYSRLMNKVEATAFKK